MKRPPNIALHQTACLLRARRCRALAAPTAAGERNVSRCEVLVDKRQSSGTPNSE
jgi:hypothetical protein